jgi:hypothetical protein
MRPDDKELLGKKVIVVFKNGKEIDGELYFSDDEHIGIIVYGNRKIRALIQRSLIDEVREVK